MNDQSPNRPRLDWLSWIAMFAFASILSPTNIHVVIAQDAPAIVVAPADPGVPPSPPQAQAAAAPAEASAETPAQAAGTQETGTQETGTQAAEPVPAEASAQNSGQAAELPATPSEVSTDIEIGKLLPTDGPLVEATPSKPAVEESVRTLSVEPGSRPMLPENRPAWVGAESDFTSDQHYLYVGSLPTLKPSQADKALDEPLVAAVRNYIDQEIVNQIGAASAMPVSAGFIRKNLIDNPEGYECELTTGQEPLYQKWVTVRITPEQRKLFRQWHAEAMQRSRLIPLGGGLVAVLSVVSLSHIVLRRFRSANPLSAVNHMPEPVAVKPKAGSSGKWVFFALLFAAIAFAFLLPLFALIPVKVESRSHTAPVKVAIPDLHKEVRIETLDGEHRTIILESKTRR